MGKSTLIPHLKLLLNKNHYDIHDFDERGVPTGVNRKWRIKETKHWLNLGKINIKNNISTIICGFSNPKEIIHNDYIELIFLDAKSEIIKQRISGRYQTEKSRQEIERVSGDTAEKFIKDNIDFLETFRNICQNDKRCSIVDTNNRLPKEIAKKIVEIMK